MNNSPSKHDACDAHGLLGFVLTVVHVASQRSVQAYMALSVFILVCCVGLWGQTRWLVVHRTPSVLISMHAVAKIFVLGFAMLARSLISRTVTGATVIRAVSSFSSYCGVGCNCTSLKIPLHLHFALLLLDLSLRTAIQIVMQPSAFQFVQLAAATLTPVVLEHAVPAVLSVFITSSYALTDGNSIFASMDSMVTHPALGNRNSQSKLGKTKLWEYSFTAIDEASAECLEVPATAGVEVPVACVSTALQADLLDDTTSNQVLPSKSLSADQARCDMLQKLTLEVHQELNAERLALGCFQKHKQLSTCHPAAYKSPVLPRLISIKVHDHRAYQHRAAIMAAAEQGVHRMGSKASGRMKCSPLIVTHALPGCLQLFVQITEPLLPSTSKPSMQLDSRSASDQHPHPTSEAEDGATLLSCIVDSLKTMHLSASTLVSTAGGAVIRCSGGSSPFEYHHLAAAQLVRIQTAVLNSGPGNVEDMVVCLEALGEEEREVELLVLCQEDGKQSRQRHRLNLPINEFRVCLPQQLDPGPVEVIVVDARPGLQGTLLANTTAFALPASAAQELRALLQREQCMQLQDDLLSDLAVAWQLPATVSSAAVQGCKELIFSLLEFFQTHDLLSCGSFLLQHLSNRQLRDRVHPLSTRHSAEAPDAATPIADLPNLAPDAAAPSSSLQGNSFEASGGMLGASAAGPSAHVTSTAPLDSDSISSTCPRSPRSDDRCLGLAAVLSTGYRHWCSQYARLFDAAALMALTILAITVNVKMTFFFPIKVQPATLFRLHYSVMLLHASSILPATLLLLGGQRARRFRSLIVLSGSVLYCLVHVLGSTCTVFLLSKGIATRLAARKLPQIMQMAVVRPALMHVPWHVQILVSMIEGAGRLMMLVRPSCHEDPSRLLGVAPLSLQQCILQQVAIAVTSVGTSLTMDWLSYLKHQSGARKRAICDGPVHK